MEYAQAAPTASLASCLFCAWQIRAGCRSRSPARRAPERLRQSKVNAQNREPQSCTGRSESWLRASRSAGGRSRRIVPRASSATRYRRQADPARFGQKASHAGTPCLIRERSPCPGVGDDLDAAVRGRYQQQNAGAGRGKLQPSSKNWSRADAGSKSPHASWDHRRCSRARARVEAQRQQRELQRVERTRRQGRPDQEQGNGTPPGPRAPARAARSSPCGAAAIATTISAVVPRSAFRTAASSRLSSSSVNQGRITSSLRRHRRRSCRRRQRNRPHHCPTRPRCHHRSPRNDDHGRIAEAAGRNAGGKGRWRHAGPATGAEHQKGDEAENGRSCTGHSRGLAAAAARPSPTVPPLPRGGAAQACRAPSLDPALQVAGPKARQNQRLDNGAGGGVGQHALEPVAGLDPHLALVRRHQEQGAVVLLRPAEVPVTKQPVRELLDAEALQRGTVATTTWSPSPARAPRGRSRDAFPPPAPGVGLVYHPAGERWERGLGRPRGRGNNIA